MDGHIMLSTSLGQRNKVLRKTASQDSEDGFIITVPEKKVYQSVAGREYQCSLYQEILCMSSICIREDQGSSRTTYSAQKERSCCERIFTLCVQRSLFDTHC